MLSLSLRSRTHTDTQTRVFAVFYMLYIPHCFYLDWANRPKTKTKKKKG